MSIKTTADFISNAKQIHGDKYDYSVTEYTGARNYLKIICKKHGEFSIYAYRHTANKSKAGCQKCALEIAVKSMTHTKDMFIEKARLKHGDRYDYSLVEYVNTHTKIKIICKEHGEFMQSPSSHTSGQGCEKCAFKATSKRLTFYENAEQMVLDCYNKLKEHGKRCCQGDVAKELGWKKSLVYKYWGSLRKPFYIGKDLTGMRFGRWTVEGKSHYDKTMENSFWNCVCDCGNRKIVASKGLKSGASQSCGCYRLDRHRDTTVLPDNLAAKNNLFRSYIRGAKDRGYSFNIDFKLFTELLDQPCHYCGLEGSNKKRIPYSTDFYYHNGIDRVDNSVGYEPDNVKPCCKYCNQMKMDMTKDEFVSHMRRAVAYQDNHANTP